MKKIFVTGIGTNIGKTIVSAILTESLNADYWKPIQSGALMNTDTMKVKKLVSNKKTVCHPEIFRLSQPLSPHASAEIDGVAIKLKDFAVPKTKNHLIILVLVSFISVCNCNSIFCKSSLISLL